MGELEEIIKECKDKGPYDSNNETCKKCQEIQSLTFNDLKGAPSGCLQYYYLSKISRELSKTINKISEQLSEKIIAQFSDYSIMKHLEIPILNILTPKITQDLSNLLKPSLELQYSLNNLISIYFSNWDLFEELWPILLDVKSIETIQKNDDSDWFIKQMKECLKHEEKSKKILEYLCSNKEYFKKREKQLHTIINSYRQSNYLISIPLSFIVIDGILSEKIDSSTIKKCQYCKQTIRFNTTNLLEKLTGKKSDIQSDTKIVLNTLKEIWTQNRNNILHGGDTDYYTNIDLALDLIIKLIYIRGTINIIEIKKT